MGNAQNSGSKDVEITSYSTLAVSAKAREAALEEKCRQLEMELQVRNSSTNYQISQILRALICSFEVSVTVFTNGRCACGDVLG
jgi:hypothetical protein